MVSPITAILLPIVLTLLYCSSAASHPLVISMCKKAMNPEFCKTSLFTYPTTEHADMKGLGIISIILATEQGRLNKYEVSQLLSKVNDPVTKNALAYCLRDYAVILNKLKKAYALSEKMDYNGVLKLVNDAIKMTNKCEDGFKKRGRLSLLTDCNQRMVWLNDIALVISNVLDG